ncbi:MAG: T9SS type A sorting domain-containing protein, partial [bacterium]|nr:T9SS type A sorting domain-containing protein [bacterium]
SGLAETEKYLRHYLHAKTKQEIGQISGSFIIPTHYLTRNVTALAFDRYGYIAGIGKTNIYSATYVIENLTPGEYYVVTVSKDYAYVDEIYDNVPAPVFSWQAWRQATKVTVSADATTENINFELQPSAEFLITIYRDSTTVSTLDEATFTLTNFDSPEKLLEGFYEYNYTDGQFTFFVPFLGDFKLGVTPENKPTTWYKSSNNWNDADRVSIPTFTNEINSLDIILNQQSSTAQVGKISGMVTGSGEFKMIFAFKASDLSLANIAFIFYSYYAIEDLEPGEYYVYAEDYLGDISEQGELLGTFYQDAATLAEAKKVMVEEGQNTYGINIKLRKGATIKGKVTDQDNNPLGEMLVVAMMMNFPEASAFNLFTQMHVGVGLADSSGNYRITGLASGDYILRTLSDYTFKIFWGFPYLDVGPHKGKVVDEFYQDVYNLFDFAKAQKIAVEDTFTVENIDFSLQKAKFFKGQLSDAVTSESINKALMVAFIDSSGFPFYTLPNIGYYGSYELGPFPSGKYRILAAADHDQKDFYLPEFYENATLFEDANVLELVEDNLENIDFRFDKAAVIQGHIDLAEGTEFQSAGEDTLFNFPVVLFNATDGSFSRNAYVQFDGGFRLPRLLPGSYKLAAIPIESPFAATYYGGGDNFEDSESQTIQVEAGQILDLNIELEKASSVIDGNVTSIATGEPVTNCLVITYDRTGHATGMGITDASLSEIVEKPATGKYQITGLRAAEYYLCTYAFADESEIAVKVPQYLMAEEADLFEMVFALLEAMFSTDMNLYADSWYNQVALRTEFNIPELVTSFLIYGMANEYDHARYPFYMPIPFQRSIPPEATAVSVSENSSAENINFQLAVDNMEDIFLDVEPDDKNADIPNDFILLSNYPNPFNSSTNIRINLPRQSNIKVSIYNIRGEEVINLADNLILEQGVHELKWTGINSKGQAAPTGLYFAVLEAENIRGMVKLMLLR